MLGLGVLFGFFGRPSNSSANKVDISETLGNIFSVRDTQQSLYMLRITKRVPEVDHNGQSVKKTRRRSWINTTKHYFPKVFVSEISGLPGGPDRKNGLRLSMRVYLDDRSILLGSLLHLLVVPLLCLGAWVDAIHP